MVEHKEEYMLYHKNELFTNEKFVENLITKISQLGIDVENLYNYPQDIEGSYYQNEVYIVQTRPQV
jgi:phosphoenolpyruvate synthase/pyruvate phosphate dikinase